MRPILDIKVLPMIDNLPVDIHVIYSNITKTYWKFEYRSPGETLFLRFKKKLVYGASYLNGYLEAWDNWELCKKIKDYYGLYLKRKKFWTCDAHNSYNNQYMKKTTFEHSKKVPGWIVVFVFLEIQ